MARLVKWHDDIERLDNDDPRFDDEILTDLISRFRSDKKRRWLRLRVQIAAWEMEPHQPPGTRGPGDTRPAARAWRPVRHWR